MGLENVHATAVVLGRTGVMIVGASGAGKSSLALALMDLCRVRSVFSTLVADDQLWIGGEAGRLVAHAPTAISGLIEIRGYGPAQVPFEKRSVIDRVVTLVDPDMAPRHRTGRSIAFRGIHLPCLELPASAAACNAQAVMGWLETAP